MNLGIILSVGDSLEKQQKSGQFERFFYYYLKSYSENFNKIFIFDYSENEFNKKLLPKNCFHISKPTMLHRYVYTILMPLIRRSSFRKCDVLRVMQATGGLPAVGSKVFYGKPYVLTFGYDYQKFAKIEDQKMVSFLIRPILFLSLKFADSIMVTNKKIQKELSILYKTKIKFIPNGVDISLFKPLKRKKNDKFKILFVGRLEKQKNLELLVESVGLSRHCSSIELLLVGGGSLRKKIVELALKKKVKLSLKGNLSYSKMPKIFGQSDMFVLLSKIEGNPKVLIEAMACGLPCIVTPSEGIAEVVRGEDVATFVRPSPPLVASAIDSLIENMGEAASLGSKAREYVQKNYNITDLVSREIKLLKRYV